MAKNLQLGTFGFLDATGTVVAGWPKAIECTITDGAATQTYLIGISNILITLDVDANYFEIRVNTAVIYKYEQGDTYQGSTMTDAQTMYTSLLVDLVQ